MQIKQEELAEKTVKSEFDKALVDKVARLGYSYFKLAAELKEQKGPAYDAYMGFAKEQKCL